MRVTPLDKVCPGWQSLSVMGSAAALQRDATISVRPPQLKVVCQISSGSAAMAGMAPKAERAKVRMRLWGIGLEPRKVERRLRGISPDQEKRDESIRRPGMNECPLPGRIKIESLKKLLLAFPAYRAIRQTKQNLGLVNLLRLPQT